MPKVSVIIPIYNVEKYLRQCLDSVINQTLKDIEIICVNDGSIDNSLKILQEYAQKDNRIIVVNQKNQGAAAARNSGIKITNSEYVGFMDPDDYYPFEDVLEVLYNKAIENNVKICGGEFSKFTNVNPDLKQNFGKWSDGYLFKKDDKVKYTDYQFDYGFTRFIYNRDFLIANEIYFPSYSKFEDPPFFVHAMILAKEFYAVDKIVYAYRIEHKANNQTTKNIMDGLSGILDNFKYANKYNLNKLREYTYRRLKSHIKSYNGKHIFITNIMLLKICFYDYLVRKEYIKKVLQKFFSILNRNNHKVITILGIKFKLRKKY